MSPLTPQPAQVLAGLVHGVRRTAEQSGRQGAQGLVGDTGDGENARAWRRPKPGSTVVARGLSLGFLSLEPGAVSSASGLSMRSGSGLLGLKSG
jgi:hypothetical protein